MFILRPWGSGSKITQHGGLVGTVGCLTLPVRILHFRIGTVYRDNNTKGTFSLLVFRLQVALGKVLRVEIDIQ